MLPTDRGVQYMLNRMRKCIMGKVGGAKKAKKNENGREVYKFC